MEELRKPLYHPDDLERDLDYVSHKLDLSRDELEEYLQQPLTPPTAYRNQLRYQSFKHALVKSANGIHWVKGLAEKFFPR
jgi:hypothetical protein